jgi:putative DNA primase/helicase
VAEAGGVVTDDDRSDEYREIWAEADRPLYPPPDAPLDVARELYAHHRVGGDGLRMLVAWRGEFMRWHTTHWSEVDPAWLRSESYDTLGGVDYEAKIKVKGEVVTERRPWRPDKRKIANVTEAMAAIGYIPADVDPPAWINLHGAAETPAPQVISCTNGLLDLSTRTMHDHTPALFNVVSVPFDYREVAAEPVTWLKFLASLWPDDPDSIALLQEYIGYVLSGRTDMQKMLLLIGPTRSGKGTIARMLTELVGRGHVAGPTLASLGTNFGLSPLLGKPLAVISDARLGNMPTHTVVERLLSITGEDMLTVDRKFRDPWSGKLPTRFAVLSNELPKFRDSSGAIANRLLILQMTNSFLGREDRTLDDRLRSELPGILNWALEGLDRLNRNGRFTVPGSSEDAANLMMDLASPMSAFVRECCVRKSDVQVFRDDLYQAWQVWADDNGHKAGAKSTFGRDLRAVVPELRDVQKRSVFGNKMDRYYARIGLLRDSPDSPSGFPESASVSRNGASGSPDSVSEIKPQVNSFASGASRKTAFKAQHIDSPSRTPCIHCGNPVAANQKDADGRTAHLSCQQQHAESA